MFYSKKQPPHTIPPYFSVIRSFLRVGFWVLILILCDFVLFFFSFFFNAFSDIFVLWENRVCSSYFHGFLRNFVVFANQISKDRLTLRSGWRGSLGHRNA